jgi:hypothetical protein
VVAGASQHILRLLYGKNIRVDPGREYPLEAIVKAGQPVVSFNGPEPTELYTLIMLGRFLFKNN